jgi:mono/diheme cytochrome c family protein
VGALAVVAAMLLFPGTRRRGGGGSLADTTHPFPSASALDTLRVDSAAAARPDSLPPDATLDSLAALGSPIVRVLAADSVAGDSLFRGRGRCFTCHGGNATGLPNLGPDLRDAEWLHGDGSVRFIQSAILAGISSPSRTPIGMPSFASQLSEADAFRIAGYVFSLSHPGVTVKDTTRTDSLPR